MAITSDYVIVTNRLIVDSIWKSAKRFSKYNIVISKGECMGRRVIIVDYQHMVYNYINSGHRLSRTVVVDGKPKVIDTTIQNGTIKAIHRWSNHGTYPTAVCFDSPVPARKAFFAKNFDMAVEGDKAYKAGRAPLSGEIFEAINDVKDVLIRSGVSCYKGRNYEADDLVFACVQKAKEDYPNTPIDIITNDADLLPLVDEWVSVFLRSKKMTWAERPDLEKAHYVQVTPANFQAVVEGLSAYNKFLIPYNSILLHKLLRGDSADNINGIKKLFPPRKYNAIVEDLFDRNIDFSKVFRYGKCKETFVSKSTGEVVGSDHDVDDLAIRYDDPQELTDLLDVLCWYIDEDWVVDYIKKTYRGMNLNQAYPGLGEISRKPAKLKSSITPFNEGILQENIVPWGIKLKLGV